MVTLTHAVAATPAVNNNIAWSWNDELEVPDVQQPRRDVIETHFGLIRSCDPQFLFLFTFYLHVNSFLFKYVKESRCCFHITCPRQKSIQLANFMCIPACLFLIVIDWLQLEIFNLIYRSSPNWKFKLEKLIKKSRSDKVILSVYREMANTTSQKSLIARWIWIAKCHLRSNWTANMKTDFQRWKTQQGKCLDVTNVQTGKFTYWSSDKHSHDQQQQPTLPFFNGAFLKNVLAAATAYWWAKMLSSSTSPITSSSPLARHNTSIRTKVQTQQRKQL